MRVTKLRNIKSFLNDIIRDKGYYMYIAPLNNEHYSNYVKIIKSNMKNATYEDILTSDEQLINLVAKINVRPDILIDTNLYVCKIGTDEIVNAYKLYDFLKKLRINYRLYLNTDLIETLENIPDDEINTTYNTV